MCSDSDSLPEFKFSPEDFLPRAGMLTRYGKKQVRPEWFAKVVISDLARRRGRFRRVLKDESSSSSPALCFPAIPRPGALVRSTVEPRQFGIVGEREGVTGVFWSGDGWVDDYGEGELMTMFGDCVEVVCE